MMSMNHSNIYILKIKDSNYCCIISLIRKNEAITLMQNADLTKKNRSIIKNEKFIFIYKNGLRYFNVWGY